MKNDDAGYKRPPKHTRFKKGQSGNPAGRPKGARSVESVLGEELRRRVTIRENGRTRHLTKLEVIVRKTVNHWMVPGGPRNIETLIKFISRFPPVVLEERPSEALTPQERQIYDRYFISVKQPEQGDR